MLLQVLTVVSFLLSLTTAFPARPWWPHPVTTIYQTVVVTADPNPQPSAPPSNSPAPPASSVVATSQVPSPIAPSSVVVPSSYVYPSSVAASSVSSEATPSPSSYVTSAMSSAAPLPSSTKASSAPPSEPSAPAPSGDGPYVFAHYMLITRPPGGDYSKDMQLAKSAGIDAFALNYGGWSTDWDQQDQYQKEFYQAAAAAGMKVFMSIDVTATDTSGKVIDGPKAASIINNYINHEAQFKVGGKAFVSSFQVDNPSWDWKNDVLSKLSADYTFVPGTLSDAGDQVFTQDIGADGYFTWLHPDVDANQEFSTDKGMAGARDQSSGKKWMAALAPWFFKRFDGTFNWAHAQDDKVFVTRAKNLLELKPDYIELTTWNDWGESSYFGPADTENTCDTCYWAKLDHSGFLTIVKHVAAAFKAGKSDITVADEDQEVFMYYRLQPSTELGNSDDTLPLPKDADKLSNNVFVVGLLNSPVTVTVSSGGTTHKINLKAGLDQQKVPWTTGDQSITYNINGADVTKKGPKPIEGQLPKYNGNVLIV
ncbi:glycoside hydrolase family 71 protein [Aulographum hederae CBS 113979]|uniref:Glycoside hydrolase family 71 protein n=1 Tax=Aulographum hederae CBS 113979 TaxID=1176131 RepID=A0A6G1GTV8_9PEZI|nr:glycoside hydrolase family 71 protein [Aulographum hederae CBS 113979]